MNDKRQSKLKINLNYTLENTLIQIKESSKELTNIKYILIEILKYKDEINNKDVLKFEK